MNPRFLLIAVAALSISAHQATARPVSIDVAAIAAYPNVNQAKHQDRRMATHRAKRAQRADAASRAPRAHRRASNRETVESRVERSALVHGINAKLARWVRPTGKCGIGQTEQLATYYNSGRRTANGETFRSHGMTAAHRTLPFGTRLTITNPHTGRSVDLRINDRGPFTNAKIDLAQGAARAIGMHTSIYVCVTGGTWASALP